MQTKIITETVLKVKEGTGHFFRGKVIVTLNDGKDIEYAVKTKFNTYNAETIMVKSNGMWVEAQPSDIVNLVTTQFSTFLKLMKGCFFSKYARNQLFLGRNRLLQDNTPATDRMKYSSRITNAVYLIDGRFIKVVYMKKHQFAPRAERVYFEMPLDMSSDWTEVTTADNQLHEQCLKAGSEYQRGLCDYNKRKYHKELVNTGIRM